MTQPAEDTPPVKEGDVLAGKYRVEKLLGAGAMGVVVAARHIHLDERVALKFLKSEFMDNKEVVARFLREAQSAVRIKGEHVARVSDVGTLETGAPYMVMEHLTGSDLGELLEKQGKLEVAQAVDFVIQACTALAEAHMMGIVHRDLKPSNLFLTSRADGSPLIKVLDFGVAKLLNNDPSKPQLTANGAVIGSPLYMSPEQLLGSKTVDARSDIWQLGVILYELITGECPFDGNTMADIMLAIGVHPAKPLRKGRPDAPAELEAVILKCLEKDAANRTPDIATLAEALLPFATTRRAQVAVEQMVTMFRGAAAAQNLPPMRAPLQSGAMLMAGAMEANGAAKADPSNPYAQTMASSSMAVASPPPPAPGRSSGSSPGPFPAKGAASASMKAAGAPAGAADDRGRLAETHVTSKGEGAAPGGGAAKAIVPWVVAGVLVIAGSAAAAFAIASLTEDKPAPGKTAPAPSAKPQ